MKPQATVAVMALMMVAGAMSAACDRPLSQGATHDGKSIEKQSEPPAVTQTAALTAAVSARKLEGVASILSSDPLLQLDADLSAATIAATFSTATAERYKATGSLSRQIIENAERQAGTDETQRKLLESRLQQNWGDAAPFLDKEKRKALIAKLSAGSDALVRMDFPEPPASAPRNAVLSALSGGATASVKAIWVAPSGNLSMPGVSYFGVIDAGPGLRAGDRARATAESAAAATGVIIPNAAIVIFAAQSWCYIETAPEKFERRIVSLDHPVEDGYLVTSGFTAGERVVVRGASLLLSREAGPGDDDDDDDAPKAKPKTTPTPVAEQSKGNAADRTDGKAAPATLAEKRGAKTTPPVDRD